MNIHDQNYYIIKYNSILGIKTDISQETDSDLEGIDLDHEYISEDIIKSLGKCLSEYSDKVRDSAATSLGIIGLPESSIAIDDLILHLKDKNIEVRSKIIWGIGRIAPAVDNSVIGEVALCIQSNMWKVKKATLYALTQFGNRCNKNILPYLINLLKESPINKQLIAETIIRMGTEGENNLLLLICDNIARIRSSICSAGCSKEKIATEPFGSLAATFTAIFKANAVLPIEGRAAKIFKLPFCKP